MNVKQFFSYTGIALIEENQTYSYQELASEIETLKEYFGSKISQHDIVCLKSDYSFKSISAFWALSQLECIIVPIVPTTDAEFQSKISAASVNKIIHFHENEIKLEQISTQNAKNQPEFFQITSSNQSGLVLFSSGTTGVPKVMVHNLSEIIEGYKTPKKSKKLNFLLFLLFDHIGGINTLLNCLNNGSEITLPSNRNPEYILKLIQDKKVQILPTTPTFLNLMLMTENFEKYDLSSLKMITYGTERMPQTLLNNLKSKIPTARFLQTFGTSETGIMRTESKSSTSLFFKIVDPDYEHKIIDGQLYLKTKNQVKGYINHESNQFDNDWFATGDLVETDEDGYIKIIGRINNVINVGGQKVLPKEVEDIINTIPGVVDSTVFGKNNIITGQMVCAEVVIAQGEDKDELKKMINQKCRQELDKYKVPSKITVTDSLGVTTRFKKSNKN